MVCCKVKIFSWPAKIAWTCKHPNSWPIWLLSIGGSLSTVFNKKKTVWLHSDTCWLLLRYLQHIHSQEKIAGEQTFAIGIASILFAKLFL
jgi:hypothetical protein